MAKQTVGQQQQQSSSNEMTTEPRVLRVAAYVRFSSRTQRDGYSIAAQQAEIEREGQAWAARTEQAWQITWHIEPERSARAEKVAARTVFRDLLASAQRGEIDMVVVHKLDRFARSLRHQLQFIHELAQSGVSFYSVVEKPDFSSPQGRMVANMFGVLAQFYSDNLGQEVKKGLYQRAEDGFPWGPPPFGYRTKAPGDHVSDRLGGGGNLPDTLPEGFPDADAEVAQAPIGAAVPDPATWEGYQTLKRLVLAGHSDSQIAALLNADGRWTPAPVRAGKFRARGEYTRERRPWTFWCVRRLRVNPFYRPFTPGDDRGTVHVRSSGSSGGQAGGGQGKQEYHEYRGRHIAGATWDEWQTMQTLRRIDTPPTGEAARYGIGEFRGLASCAACGERLYTIRSYGRDRETRAIRAVYEQLECPAYRWSVACPSAAGRVRAQDLSAAWTRWLAAAFPAEAFPLDWERSVLQQVQAYLRRQRQSRQSGEQSGGPVADTAALGPAIAVDPKRLASDVKRWQARRQAAIDARLDGWIEVSEARTRVAEADQEIARLQALQRGAEQVGGGQEVADAREIAQITASLRVGQQSATWAALWPQMTREERIRAASLMIEPEGLRVRVPAKGQQGRHNHATVGLPGEEVLRAMIVEVRLRPDFAHALSVLTSTRSVVG